MNKLEKAKEIIKANFKCGSLGLYDERNWAGDPMANIYNNNGLIVDICYKYEYFEVFGLTDKEFSELIEYYESLCE